MLSDKTAIEFSFALILLSQEQAFGLVPKFSDEAKPLLDIPANELTEEQAFILIDDMTEQRRRFFAAEAEAYNTKDTYYHGDEGDKKCDTPAQC